MMRRGARGVRAMLSELMSPRRERKGRCELTKRPLLSLLSCSDCWRRDRPGLELGS